MALPEAWPRGPLLTWTSRPLPVLIPCEVRREDHLEAAPGLAHMFRSGPDTRLRFCFPCLSCSQASQSVFFGTSGCAEGRPEPRPILSPQSLPTWVPRACSTLPACWPIQTRSVGPRVPLPSHTLGHIPFPGEKPPRLWSFLLEGKESEQGPGFTACPPLLLTSTSQHPCRGEAGVLPGRG